MYYYENGLMGGYILYINGDEMYYFSLRHPYEEWTRYGNNANDYFVFLRENPEFTHRVISKKTVILLGVPLCK